MPNPDVPLAGEVIEDEWGAAVVSRLVPIYVDAAARDTALPLPEEGQLAFTKDDNRLWVYITQWTKLGRDSQDLDLGGGVATATRFLALDGTVAAPSLGFANHLDLGVYRIAGGGVGVAVGGDARLLIQDGFMHIGANDFDGAIRIKNGPPYNDPLAPPLHFRGDADTGVVRPGADRCDLVAGGVIGLDVRPAEVRSNVILADTTTNAASLMVTGSGIIKHSTSSGKVKGAVADFGTGYAHQMLDSLRPVTFKSVLPGDNQDDERAGFIAEDVATHFPQATVGAEAGYDVRSLVAALWAEVQDLRSRVATLEAATT